VRPGGDSLLLGGAGTLRLLPVPYPGPLLLGGEGTISIPDPCPGYVVCDQFFFTPGDDLDGTYPHNQGGKDIGYPWVRGQGAFTQTGIGVAGTSLGDSQYWIETGLADCETSTYWYITAGASWAFGIVFRVVDNDNHWLFYIFNGTCQAYYKQSGSYTFHSGSSVTTSPGIFTADAVTIGNAVTLYINGIPKLSFSDSLFVGQTKSGIYGLGISNPLLNQPCTFFQVKSSP
jgi:hypothetical protein